ncbi:MarR family winged helix-turn-helix transcriptional regulator [Nocardia sp. NPDC049526]|uniref:MarR family winged helix-turn-helix transcriptional regulator n=1 Tax=Nocardia sp. NPDC049526 TaxID=3364316 RepID=UPI00379ED0CC
MDKILDKIEFETMLFGRYSLASRQLGGRRLDRNTYTLLNRLRVAGPMTLGQLSEAVGQDVSTLNRRTAAMVRDDVVERIPDPDGGMARKFRITAEGERQLDRERDESLQTLATILADWSPQDAAAFADYLQRFNIDIERYLGRPWPRP